LSVDAVPHVPAEGYPEYMRPSPKTGAVEAIRAGLIDLLNDPNLTTAPRLRQLQQPSEEIEGFIFDVRSRVPSQSLSAEATSLNRGCPRPHHRKTMKVSSNTAAMGTGPGLPNFPMLCSHSLKTQKE
jgi:hypothetical protein